MKIDDNEERVLILPQNDKEFSYIMRLDEEGLSIEEKYYLIMQKFKIRGEVDVVTTEKVWKTIPSIKNLIYYKVVKNEMS